MLQSVIFNFGDLGTLTRPDAYQVCYIAEYNAKLLEKGIRCHADPDLVGWLFGDYPRKSSKSKLAALRPGDYIFFTTSLESGGVRKQFFIAMMRLMSISTLAELIQKYGDAKLATVLPYCTHPHVQRYLIGKGESEDCTFFRGDPAGSLVIKTPIPFDRAFVRRMYDHLSNSKEHEHSKNFNWYYNNPNFPDTFGHKKDRKGRLLSDTQMIGSKFRNVPLMPKEITGWLVGRFRGQTRLDPSRFAACGIRQGPVMPRS